MAGATPLEGPSHKPPRASAPAVDRRALRKTFSAAPWVLGLVIAGATWASTSLTRFEGGVASVWIANGLLVGVLLPAPQRNWPALGLAAAVAMVATRALNGDDVWLAVGLTAINLVESGLIAGAIRRAVPDIRVPAALPRLARVAVASTIAACAMSATLAMLLLATYSGVVDVSVWRVWFAAHLLGMVIVATITVTAVRLGWLVFGRPGHRMDLVVCAALLAATCVAIAFQDRLSVLFLAYLPLMLLTVRHGFAGVVIGTGVLAIASGVGAVYALGPFGQIAHATTHDRALLLQLFVGAGCLLTYPMAVALTEQRRLVAQLAYSGSRYRLLAEHSRDLIVRMDAKGNPLYVSPSTQTLLGRTPDELMVPRWDLVHPDDRVRIDGQLRRLFQFGGTTVTTYRLLHKDGHYVWIEVIAHRVDSVDPPEVVYSGRDVTSRIEVEDALLESQGQLQAVTDNTPAMIAYFDNQERFTFANATVGRVLGLDREQIIGRTLREVRGEAIYAEMAHHVAAVLAGQAQTFEGRAEIRGRMRDHTTRFVPDFGSDGAVRGFFSLTSDITALKHAERELVRLARFDSLTGLANRRHFEESLQAACSRAMRNGSPLMLFTLDLDHFKAINDTRGHAAGDTVLQAFATRIRECVYEVDLPARLGGDEFVILIEHAPTAEAGAAVAERILDAMRIPISVAGEPLLVSASIGVGIHFPVRDADRLRELADEALYDAKAAGRGVWRIRSG